MTTSGATPTGPMATLPGGAITEPTTTPTTMPTAAPVVVVITTRPGAQLSHAQGNFVIEVDVGD